MGHPVDPHMSFIYLSEPLMGMEAFGKMALRRTLACLLTLALLSPLAGLAAAEQNGQNSDHGDTVLVIAVNEDGTVEVTIDQEAFAALAQELSNETLPPIISIDMFIELDDDGNLYLDDVVVVLGDEYPDVVTINIAIGQELINEVLNGDITLDELVAMSLELATDVGEADVEPEDEDPVDDNNTDPGTGGNNETGEDSCELTLTADHTELYAGDTLNLSWTMTGQWNESSPQVWISVFSGWGAQYHHTSIEHNTGSFSMVLPSDLDPSESYHAYIESADNRERTTLCWDYASFDVLEEESDPEPEDEEPCDEHPWEDDDEDDWPEFDEAWQELIEEYDERLTDIEERERDAFNALSEECNEAWAELFENFNEDYDELQEQLEESLDELEENYQSDLETSYAVYQHEFDELLELLDNTTTEEEYDAVVQQMVDLLLQETSSIESLNDYYELWSEQIHNESEPAMDELYDQLDADAAAVDEECHEAMEHLEEQFSQEYEDLDDWYQEQAEMLDARMLELVGEDPEEPADERHPDEEGPDEEDVNDTSANSDMESMGDFGIGDTVPGFTGLLSVAAMSGAVLLVGRRRLL